MIRRAREIGRANPADVVFLDFDGRDFDAHQEVRPAIIDSAFWKRAIQVALDDVADLVAPERVILCEGEAATARQGKLSFDAHCYNTIFANEFPHVIFVPGGNAYEVAMDRRGISNVIGAIAQGVQVGSVIDRDDRNAMEIAELTRAGVKVLSRRAIESYLLDDAVLAQVCTDLGAPEAAADLVAARLVALTASAGRGNRPDDLKSASGEIYVAAKRLLQNAKLGNDGDAFLRAFCAPALTRVQTVYEELRQDVFGGAAQA
jgi:hypothetical protein